MAKKVEEVPLSRWERRQIVLSSQGYSPYLDAAVYMDGEQSKGVYNPDQVASVFPVNPLTGYASGDLSRLMSPLITQREKEEIMSRLQRQDGTYMPSDLSDDEILALVPPRYIAQDAVDVGLWRDHLQQQLFPDGVPSSLKPIMAAPADSPAVEIEDEE